MVTDTKDVALFERFSRFYDLLNPKADADLLAEALAQADRPVNRIADVGGGTGRAARVIDAPERIVVDASAGMLSQARAHGLDVVRGDAARVPIADDSVDAVVVADALHHIHDVDAVLAESKRVLRPGGALVVREYNPATLRGRLLVRSEHLFGFDSTFLTPDELVRRLADAGLVPRVRNRGFDYTAVGVDREPGTQ